MFEKQLNQIYPSISISTSISFVNSAITLGKYSRLSTSIDFFFPHSSSLCFLIIWKPRYLDFLLTYFIIQSRPTVLDINTVQESKPIVIFLSVL